VKRFAVASCSKWKTNAKGFKMVKVKLDDLDKISNPCRRGGEEGTSKRDNSKEICKASTVPN